MDVETCSLIVVVAVNLGIVFCIGVYLALYYKWDNKTYDDMGDNLEHGRRQTYNNDLYFAEGASNIESLLAKDDTVG